MSDELNCSDGARTLIERMRTNPEEFRGPDARWAMAINQMLQVRRGGFESNLVMSRRDMAALFDAFETHIMETGLMEHVLGELTNPRAQQRKNVGIRPLGKAQLTEEYQRAYMAQQRMDYEADRARLAGQTQSYNPFSKFL